MRERELARTREREREIERDRERARARERGRVIEGGTHGKRVGSQRCSPQPLPSFLREG